MILNDVSTNSSIERLLLEIVSSAKAIDVLIPTPNSRSSLSLKLSRLFGSSDLPRLVRKSYLVSVDA